LRYFIVIQPANDYHILNGAACETTYSSDARYAQMPGSALWWAIWNPVPGPVLAFASRRMACAFWYVSPEHNFSRLSLSSAAAIGGVEDGLGLI